MKTRRDGTGRDRRSAGCGTGRDYAPKCFRPANIVLLFVEKKIVFPMIFLETVSPSAKAIEFTVSGPTRVEVATGFSAGSGSAILNSL